MTMEMNGGNVVEIAVLIIENCGNYENALNVWSTFLIWTIFGHLRGIECLKSTKGQICYRTSKTLYGESDFIFCNLSTLTPEKAENSQNFGPISRNKN